MGRRGQGSEGEGGGGSLPQIFEPPIFWGQQEKIWAKPVFKDVFMFFLLLLFFYFFMFDVFFIFIIILLFFKILT